MTSNSSYEQQQTSSSGINTVKEMRSRFSGPNVQHSQTLPRNFLSAPQPSQPAFNSSASPTSFDSSAATKVRNASPLPFGRHATTTNKAHYENSYTKTQFHNSLYQPPKGPMQHSIASSARSFSSGGHGGHVNAARRQFGAAHEYHAQPTTTSNSHTATYDAYQQQKQHAHQQQYHEPQHQQQQQHQYNEHVSRSQFRTPAQARHNTAPVFRNVTNFCWCR